MNMKPPEVEWAEFDRKQAAYERRLAATRENILSWPLEDFLAFLHEENERPQVENLIDKIAEKICKGDNP